MPDDASYSIAERQAIRRAAETAMNALGLPQGQVTRVAAESCLGLLQLFFRTRIPLSAECYDLSTFDIQTLSFSKPNLLRLGDGDGDQRVMEIASGLVLYFPDTVGQAPVVYLESKARPSQPHLYLQRQYLDEWSQPVEYHQALIAPQGVIYAPEEIIAQRRAEMNGEREPLPELLSFISAGIAVAVHVAPRQFCYRFPEYALSQVVRWTLDDLQETLQETMERLTRSKGIIREE